MTVRAYDRGPTTRTATTTDGVDTLAVSIVRAIAAARNEDPVELSIELYDYVDISALERLIDHARANPNADLEMSFAVEGLEVTVTGDGTVSVD